MILYPDLISILLLIHICTASRRSGHPPKIPIPGNPKSEDTSSPSRPKHRNPTHISDFTDPDTGLNPFLDLQEGRSTDGTNRRVMDRVDDQPLPNLSEGDSHIIEGDSNDRGSGRRGSSFSTRWPSRNFDNFDKSNNPDFFKPEDDLSKRMKFQNFDEIKEDEEDNLDYYFPDLDYPVLPSEKEEKTLIVTTNVEYSSTEYSTTYDISKILNFQTSPNEELTFSKNVVLSAIITGAVVISFATIVIFCWWKQKCKKNPVSHTDTFKDDVESNKNCENFSKQNELLKI